MRLGKWLVCFSLWGLALAGCQEEPRVPYIRPTLKNWPQPYRGTRGLRVHIFNTGWLHVPEAFVLRGGSLTRARDLPVPAVVIEHPTHGLILFNTGLYLADADSAPWSGWASLVGVSASRTRGLKEQMQAAKLKPDAVRWIVVSDLRFDHVGELEAFPKARVVVTKAEIDAARRGSDGYEPKAFDDVTEWKFIDFASAAPLATFTAHVDLFGDGSCLLVDATGATVGSMALLLRLRHQPFLLADGMASVEASLRYAARPASAADMDQWWQHIWQLKKFRDLVPTLIVLPGRALKPVPPVDSPAIVVHQSAPPPSNTLPTPSPRALDRLIPKPM